MLFLDVYRNITAYNLHCWSLTAPVLYHKFYDIFVKFPHKKTSVFSRSSYVKQEKNKKPLVELSLFNSPEKAEIHLFCEKFIMNKLPVALGRINLQMSFLINHSYIVIFKTKQISLIYYHLSTC
ncbi:CLUMA_CG007334, isoform A [Clunio marinus]|uniref:CLUMA_CG007334, isoform A n=1 Tax=Clunio marinus TaxID=568069 RepID=A0A1J1I0D6_9DIPT|nr:CLUMA_CG007334, isoform A [Clunio marinus]